MLGSMVCWQVNRVTIFSESLHPFDFDRNLFNFFAFFRDQFILIAQEYVNKIQLDYYSTETVSPCNLAAQYTHGN